MCRDGDVPLMLSCERVTVCVLWKELNIHFVESDSEAEPSDSGGEPADKLSLFSTRQRIMYPNVTYHHPPRPGKEALHIQLVQCVGRWRQIRRIVSPAFL